MKRRHFLALLSTTALAGCAGAITTDITLSATVLGDVSLIASGLTTSLGALTGLPIYSQIAGYVTQIQNAASLITSTMPQASAQSDVQAIETAVNDILGIAAAASLPTPFGPALTAASVLLPLLEDAVGLVVGSATNAAMVRMTMPMTPDEARQVLHNIVGH